MSYHNLNPHLENQKTYRYQIINKQRRKLSWIFPMVLKLLCSLIFKLDYMTALLNLKTRS